MVCNTSEYYIGPQRPTCAHRLGSEAKHAVFHPPDVWLCGCVAVGLCGCVAVWLCGCVVVWLNC